MANIKDNLTGIVAPAAINDTTQGYGPGSEWFNLSSGAFYKCLDATANAAAWMEVAPEYLTWPVGDYRVPASITGVSDSSGITANLLTMLPILISRRVQIDRIALRVTTVQPDAAVRLGLYDTNPATRRPGSLVVDGGEIALASGTGDRWCTVNTSLKPGLYWTACLIKSVATMPTLRRVAGGVYGVLTTQTLDELFLSSAYRYLSATQAYGPLPAAAPAMTPDATAQCPVIALRRSA